MLTWEATINAARGHAEQWHAKEFEESARLETKNRRDAEGIQRAVSSRRVVRARLAGMTVPDSRSNCVRGQKIVVIRPHRLLLEEKQQ